MGRNLKGFVYILNIPLTTQEKKQKKDKRADKTVRSFRVVQVGMVCGD